MIQIRFTNQSKTLNFFGGGVALRGQNTLQPAIFKMVSSTIPIIIYAEMTLFLMGF